MHLRAILIAALLLALLPQSAAADSTARIIVQREPGLTAAERADVRADAGAELVEALSVPRTEVITVPRAELSTALRTLRRDPDVAVAQRDRIVRALAPPNDPYYPSLWGLQKMAVPAAWDMSVGAGRTVAVVDSGVHAGHADLAGGLAPGFDWVQQDVVPQDSDGHGTHVTGTVAARSNNGVGVAGVAPGSRVLPLRVLGDDGSGHVSDILEAFQFAAEQKVRVVNASFGAVGASALERDVIARHPETLFVAAAGNSNVDNDGPDADYPCSYTVSNILCVGASTQSDARATFSNYGAASVDVYAPGQGIWSTTKNGGYGAMSGTSMAAPHVAALAALLLARNPTLTTAQLKAKILDTADDHSGFVKSVSGGRVNAEAALAAVTADRDGDGFTDEADNCPAVENPDQDPGQPDVEGGAACEPGVPPVDADGDGVADPDDACPYEANDDSAVGCPGTMGDADRDTLPDMLDDCPGTFGSLRAQGCVDSDNDGVANLKPSGARDNCVSVPNPTQADLDRDGVGDACDTTPRGHDNDRDGKAALDDACPAVYGTQPNGCPPPDTDNDGRADSLDACPTEGAISANGCPIPSLTGLSAKVRKRGTQRAATVKVRTNRAATVRITVQRKKGRRWVRVARKTLATQANAATYTARRLRRGSHRAVVAVFSSAGNGATATKSFRVR